MADRRRLAATVVAAALAVTACAAPDDAAEAPADAPSPAAGISETIESETVPDIAVQSFDGGQVSLTEYAGTPLVVNFWASWCPPCVAEMPDLEAVHQLADDQVEFVGINTQDAPDEADRLVDDTGVTYDLVRDPDADLFQAFGVFGMPSTFYVDADGTIVDRHTGLLTRDALLDDLRDHLGVDLGSDA